MQTDTSATHQVAIAIPVPFDTALARSFLMEAIENCFNKRNGKYEAIVTKRYGKLLEDGYDLLNMEMNGNES
ncbi:MAG TPA: hypothetical protein PKD90_00910 [Phnomibacter sp.]|nr:hypothetical protein [Phnomibacter sp.]